MRSLAKLWLLITAVLLIVSGAAYGSGFSLFEQGAKATAMGGAFAATADDPTAIFYNVAGIAQQRKAAFMVGGTTINFSNEFTGDPKDLLTLQDQVFAGLVDALNITPTTEQRAMANPATQLRDAVDRYRDALSLAPHGASPQPAAPAPNRRAVRGRCRKRRGSRTLRPPIPVTRDRLRAAVRAR